MNKKCEHNYKEFRLHGDKGSWPVRECSKCNHRQVLSGKGWVDDDWDNWGIKLKRR